MGAEKYGGGGGKDQWVTVLRNREEQICSQKQYIQEGRRLWDSYRVGEALGTTWWSEELDAWNKDGGS